jgi:hypothetical protein
MFNVVNVKVFDVFVWTWQHCLTWRGGGGRRHLTDFHLHTYGCNFAQTHEAWPCEHFPRERGPLMVPLMSGYWTVDRKKTSLKNWFSNFLVSNYEGPQLQCTVLWNAAPVYTHSTFTLHFCTILQCGKVSIKNRSRFLSLCCCYAWNILSAGETLLRK